ncbi:major facilitator superfamily domain-containing protein [Phycomyces nitens]|nr:major facilitator superfamily domain-containing protein [Phycomyces nitens]
MVEESNVVLKTYPQAWLALFILVLLRVSVSVFQYTYSVVPGLTAEYFNVGLTAINWLANVQGVVYVIMSLFTGWLFEHFGVKRTVTYSSGSRIHITKISFFIYSLCSLHFSAMVSALLCAGVFIPVIFMPSKPPTPPSLIQEQDKPSFFKGLKMLGTNYNFWVIFAVHSINVGLSISFGTLFTQILSPYGYTNIQAGQINAVAFFAGTLGCSVAGPVLDMTKQHLLFLRLIAPMVVITDIAFIFISKETRESKVVAFAYYNYYFIASYPVADASTNSILWQGAQIFGIILVSAMDAMRDTEGTPKNNLFRALILQAVLAGVMMVLAFLFRGRMKRSEAIALEKKRQAEHPQKKDGNRPEDFQKELTKEESLTVFP